MGNWDDKGGSFVKILRDFAVKTVTIPLNGALSDAVDISQFAGGVLEIPAVMTACNLGFKFCDTEGGTYKIVGGKDATVAEISNVKTGEARGYDLPAELFGLSWIKVWSKATSAETDVNQGAARTIKLFLKG